MQAHKTSSENSRGGIGLGLSIVKKHLEQIKGIITVESELGKGSIFRVALPKNYDKSRSRAHRFLGFFKLDPSHNRQTQPTYAGQHSDTASAENPKHQPCDKLIIHLKILANRPLNPLISFELATTRAVHGPSRPTPLKETFLIRFDSAANDRQHDLCRFAFCAGIQLRQRPPRRRRFRLPYTYRGIDPEGMANSCA